MSHKYYFNQQDIPYDTLQKFGLTKEMIDDLPEQVMTKLLRGQWTPPLPVIYKNQDKELVGSKACIKLAVEDNKVSVFFAPWWTTEDCEDFSQEQQEALKDGKTIIADTIDNGPSYVQYDVEINQARMAPYEIIKHNIENYGSFFPLTALQTRELLAGNDVTVSNNGEEVTIGIDLSCPTCILEVRGSHEAWVRQHNTTMPKYNFGDKGCWMLDDTGMLMYVREEDYDEAIRNEMMRMGVQHAAAAQAKQMTIN